MVDILEGHRFVQTQYLDEWGWSGFFKKWKNLRQCDKSFRSLGSMERHGIPISALLISRTACLNNDRYFESIFRQILRLMLPWYENTVKRRELTKAAYIQIIHDFRLAFRHLGKLLVQESILPEVDLLYFLSLWEIGQIIQTRNPNLLKK